MADQDQKLAKIESEKMVRDEIRRNIITDGKFPQAKVEEVLGQVGDLPPALVQAYLDM